MDREAWRAAVHGVAKSWTQLSDQTGLIASRPPRRTCCVGHNHTRAPLRPLKMMLDILLCISRYFRSIVTSGAPSSLEHPQSRHLTDLYTLLTSQEVGTQIQKKAGGLKPAPGSTVRFGPREADADMQTGHGGNPVWYLLTIMFIYYKPTFNFQF